MSLFHTHLFIPNEKNSDILFCRCGMAKDIHRHQWEKYIEIERTKEPGGGVGVVLKCSICGLLKNHYIYDY